jgi:glycosyltransferase involved in cell wall biosynthesis
MSTDAIRERFGWTDGRQVVLHAGNIGLKQGLDQVVDAARLAQERRDPVRFVFSGGGSQEEAIRAAASDVDNVEFLGLQPDGVHASLLATADVLLLSERSSQVDMSLPSKLTSYYTAGRPIVAAVGVTGASAEEVRRSGSGLVAPAGQPEALLEALSRLRSDPDLAVRLGTAGRAYGAANVSAGTGLARGAELIDMIATDRPRGAAFKTAA